MMMMMMNIIYGTYSGSTACQILTNCVCGVVTLASSSTTDARSRRESACVCSVADNGSIAAKCWGFPSKITVTEIVKSVSKWQQ